MSRLEDDYGQTAVAVNVPTTMMVEPRRLILPGWAGMSQKEDGVTEDADGLAAAFLYIESNS